MKSNDMFKVEGDQKTFRFRDLSTVNRIGSVSNADGVGGNDRR